MKRIGFLRVLDEENTIIPCLLSVAPACDHILILWSDTKDNSINLALEWKESIKEQYQCEISVLQYPHHVVPPHFVNDLRIIPAENRIDTYLNFGMEHIKGIYGDAPYCVGKIDGDQIYFTEHLESAFQRVKTGNDCVAIRGHNTLVQQGKLMLYKPGPVNGGKDCLICGKDNLPTYRINAFYEVDVTPHRSMQYHTDLCWMHFMRLARHGGNIREFRPQEIAPIGLYPSLHDKYEQSILPIIKQSGSLYSSLETTL